MELLRTTGPRARGSSSGWQGRNIAEAISEAGHITGVTNAFGGPLHAFLWRTGTMTDLGTLGGLKSFGLDVNASDQVVGWSDYDRNSQDEHAFLWVSGAMRDLGTQTSDREYRLGERGGYNEDRKHLSGRTATPLARQLPCAGASRVRCFPSVGAF